MLRLIDENEYLNNLLTRYGNLNLEQLLFKFQYRSLKPIDQCRFECVFTYQNSGNVSPGVLNQFTGTIKEFLQKILLPQYTSQNIRDKMLEITSLFENCGNTTYLGVNSEINIILYPIDRKVTWDEVRDYLTILANELAKIERT